MTFQRPVLSIDGTGLFAFLVWNVETRFIAPKWGGPYTNWENKIRGGDFMIHHATDLIEKTFFETDMKHQVVARDKFSIVKTAFDGNLVKNVIIYFVSDNENNDVVIHSSDIARYPEDKRDMGYRRCNTLNDRYRFVKFVMDDDGEISVRSDFLVEANDDCLGMMAREALIRISKIVDEAYRDIMMDILL